MEMVCIGILALLFIGLPFFGFIDEVLEPDD